MHAQGCNFQVLVWTFLRYDQVSLIGMIRLFGQPISLIFSLSIARKQLEGVGASLVIRSMYMQDANACAWLKTCLANLCVPCKCNHSCHAKLASGARRY